MTSIKHTVFLLLAAAAFSLTGCGEDSALPHAEKPNETTTDEGRNQVRTEEQTNRYATEVFEYTPAPGQFINDSRAGGMPSDMTDPREAANWALERLNQKHFVSLGAFGGYITVGFDHEVTNSQGDYDFAIFGNAFLSPAGSSDEPGIVYVMEDTNDNGLPDDIWYELRGSEYSDPSTIHDYAVTYFRPTEEGQPVEWRDNLGTTGSVDYLQAFHKQDFYYPAWIMEDYYTLAGTRLAPRTYRNPETGFWVNEPFPWGYADNMGDDNTSVDGMPQANRFRISDAVDAEGKSVDLKAIRFVKVQTGIQMKAGQLGEVSTEVLGFYDLMTEPADNAVPMVKL